MAPELLNEINLDKSFVNSKLTENNYENLDIKKHRHKFTKSIDDDKFEQVF
jgi:hypothetical protein